MKLTNEDLRIIIYILRAHYCKYHKSGAPKLLVSDELHTLIALLDHELRKREGL